MWNHPVGQDKALKPHTCFHLLSLITPDSSGPCWVCTDQTWLTLLSLLLNFYPADILACRSKTSTGVADNTSDGSLPFKCHSERSKWASMHILSCAYPAMMSENVCYCEKGLFIPWVWGPHLIPIIPPPNFNLSRCLISHDNCKQLCGSQFNFMAAAPISILSAYQYLAG